MQRKQKVSLIAYKREEVADGPEIKTRDREIMTNCKKCFKACRYAVYKAYGSKIMHTMAHFLLHLTVQ